LDALDDLLIGLGVSRIGGMGVSVALNVADEPQHDLDGFEVGFGRAIDELRD
jgi:hypothetical protein